MKILLLVLLSGLWLNALANYQTLSSSSNWQEGLVVGDGAIRQILQLSLVYAEAQIARIQAVLSQSPQLQQQYGEQLAQLAAQQQILSQKSGQQAINELANLHVTLFQLQRAIQQSQHQSEQDYSLTVEQQINQLILETQSQVVRIWELLTQNPQLHEIYAGQLTELAIQQQRLSRQSGTQAFTGLKNLQVTLTRLQGDVELQSAQGYSQQGQQPLQRVLQQSQHQSDQDYSLTVEQLISQLIIQTQSQVARIWELLSQNPLLQELYGGQLAELAIQQQRLSRQSGAQAFTGLINLKATLTRLQLDVELQSAQGYSQQGQQHLQQIALEQLQHLQLTISQSLDLEQEYGQQVASLRSQAQSLSQQSVSEAIQGLVNLIQNIQQVYEDVIERIQGGLN